MTIIPKFMIFFTPIMVISTTNWFMIWIIMELNMMFFIFYSKNIIFKKNEEMMKYFMIQTVSSIMILFTILMNSNLNNKSSNIFINMNSLIMMIMFMIKLTIPPMHFWIMPILKLINWNPFLILITWQKIIPMTMFYLFNNMKMWMFFMITIILSTLYQMNINNMKYLLYFSSMANLSWMLIIMIIKSMLTITLFLMYIIMVTPMIYFMKNMNLNYINFKMVNKNLNLILILVLSMAGVPPLLGFMFKWFSMIMILKYNMYIIIMFFLLMTILNTYIYLKIILNFILKHSNFLWKNTFKNNKFMMFMQFSFLIFMPLI